MTLLEVWGIFSRLADFMGQLAGEGVFVCDLKPDKILVKQESDLKYGGLHYQMVLTDLGGAFCSKFHALHRYPLAYTSLYFSEKFIDSGEGVKSQEEIEQWEIFTLGRTVSSVVMSTVVSE